MTVDSSSGFFSGISAGTGPGSCGLSEDTAQQMTLNTQPVCTCKILWEDTEKSAGTASAPSLSLTPTHTPSLGMCFSEHLISARTSCQCHGCPMLLSKLQESPGHPGYSSLLFQPLPLCFERRGRCQRDDSRSFECLLFPLDRAPTRRSQGS